MPIKADDYDQPDWETIIELAFPPWNTTTAEGCPTCEEIGGTDCGEFPIPQDGKWNPCYYTKAFAGLDPKLGGYPTPLDTHYPYEFPAPFLGQPGAGSVHHCPPGNDTQPIGKCQKLGNTCGKDCAEISDDYGIGHIPPFVPLAAIKMEYDSCGTADICENWFHYPTNGCNILKSELDKMVYKQFGNGTQVKFPGPKDPDSPTYYRLEYIDQDGICDTGECFGPHYCKDGVAPDTWGDFCPYVHTGDNSGQYRHPHIALAALELWIANQCMPNDCPATWLDSPNGKGYADSNETATSIVWAEMEDDDFAISQPVAPYAWPNSGEGKFPGVEPLYSDENCFKPAPGLYATEFLRCSAV